MRTTASDVGRSTTIPKATAEQRERLLRAADEIRARRPDVLHNGSTILVEFADGATVTVEPSPRDGCAVLRVANGRQSVNLDLSASVLLDLFGKVDESVTRCAACGQPQLRNDVDRCILDGVDVCADDCHRSSCSNWSECMGDYDPVGI